MRIKKFLSKTGRLGLVAAIAFAVTIPSLALARGHDHDDDDRYRVGHGNRGYYDRDEVFYIAKVNGYDLGFQHGREDCYRNRGYDFYHSKDYRKGDRGWRGEYRDKRLYQEGFRSGYEKGYYDGYYNLGRRRLHRPGGNRDDWYRDRRDRDDDRDRDWRNPRY